jgi:sodium/bile acid cotransporter 7
MSFDGVLPMKSAIVATLVTLMAASAAALADRELSDVRKKEIVYAMYADYKSDFPEVPDIEPQEAMRLMKNSPVVFVDTRKPAEMAVSMLPEAVSKEAFLSDIEAYRDRIIVGYCTISYRSGIFAREMAAKGVEIRNLRGGILAWTLEGGTVYDDGKPVKRIHVYGDKWDYAPRGYETVKFSIWDRMF